MTMSITMMNPSPSWKTVLCLCTNLNPSVLQLLNRSTFCVIYSISSTLEKSRGPSGARLLGSGPSGLLDNVLHALRPLRPCDTSNGAMIRQCIRDF